MVDPTDPLTFWTFQEWVANKDIWATQITEVKVTRPAAVPEPASGVGLLAFANFFARLLLKSKQVENC